MFCSSRLAACSFAGVLCFGSVTLADDPVIQEIAPRDSVMMLSIPNWPRARDAFLATPLGRLWNDPAMQEWIGKAWKELQDDPEAVQFISDFKEQFEKIGEPSGSIGMAFAWGKPVAPNATEAPGRGGLFLFDYGANAEKTEAAVIEFLEEQERKDVLTLTPITIAGIEAHEIEFKVTAPEFNDPDMDDAADDGMDDDDFDDDDLAGLPGMNPGDLGAMFSGMPGAPLKGYLARSGGAIIFASSRDLFEHAVDTISGANRPTLIDNPDYAAAVAQHPAGSHFFAAMFMTDDFRASLSTMGDEIDPDLPLPVDPQMFTKVFDTLGLTPLRAVSLAARLDAAAPGGVQAVEQTIGVLIPEKKGLFNLLELEPAAFEPPVWAGADASGLSSVAIRFDRIIPLLEEIVRALPPDAQQFADGGVQFLKTSIGPALAAMGPDMHTLNTVSRPLSPKSQQSVVGIKVRDELAVANAITSLAAQLGIEPRDFQGGQIYDGPGMGAGLGFGWVFIGPGPGIENAMRRAANPGDAADTLDRSDRYRRAIDAANAAGRGFMQSWTDDQTSIDVALWGVHNAEAITRAQWEDLGMDPEDVDEMMEGFEVEIPAWLKDVPPAEVFKRYLDCSAFSIRSTPEGFRATYISLPPRK